ncbi:hypothetical protein [Parapedobacter tibetensis]|uniref:hypothetical protein n=1 Tax=Parapedobacter tibetensis TaxID=2972951 RepID=UPI00214DE098|nr:hypothetical protein [Parapedobacter tibetensis]
MKEAIHPNTRYGEGGQTWVVWSKRIRVKVKRWKAQLYREYLKRKRGQLAQTTRIALRYIRLIIRFICMSRGMVYRTPALPYGAFHESVHDRRYALFRRRAVGKAFRMSPLQIPAHPRRGQPLTD